MPSDVTDDGAPVQRFIRPPLADAPPKSDLSNSVYEGVTLAGRDLNQCLFTESFFRRCSFTDVDFNNSDFDGTRFEECEFSHCDFGDCDVRAASVQNSKFIDCSFNSVYISDCTFDRVEFTHIAFTSAALAENSFGGSTFNDCNLARSTFTLSRLHDCRFVDMVLGNSTFLYVVAHGCLFERCVLNAESVGMIYGLSREDLGGFKFMFLGQLQEAPEPSDLLTSIADEYQKRGWLLGLTVLRLNFGLTSAFFAIREYVAALWRQVENGRPPKRDDLQFFSTVLSELARDERLPMLGCMDVLEMTWRALDRFEQSSSIEARHSGTALHRLSSELLLLAQERLAFFNGNRIPFENMEGDQIRIATLTFQRPPSVPVAQFITALTAGSGLLPIAETTRISFEQGSYVEKVRTTLFSLVALQMAVFLLNGTVIQITELKERVKVLTSPGTSSTYVLNARDPNQQIPPVLQRPLDELTQMLRTSEVVRSPDLKGYSEQNLHKVNVQVPPGGAKDKRPVDEKPH